MTSNEIRNSFLEFFKNRDHRIVPSAPVVPHDDPTLLFANAGMNQFKDVFLGTGSRDYVRAADTQKCIRVSGKHNDLEEVGRDTYHHTFFEMLGNWSFGDYYKREAISWAWELLTVVWKLPRQRLHVTVFRDDDEAFELWKEVTDIDHSHIHRFDEKDNFWEMGETGPCGPCSEIHIDLTDNADGGDLVNAGSPLVMEIWNLVFIQYFRDENGVLTELPAKHVDTGMGFERICAVLQGKRSNYDTDVFAPLLEEIARLSGKSGEVESDATAMRVIADHIRMLTFAIADGATPGSEGRSYVLRRILRRAARFGRTLGFHEPFLWKLVETLSRTMGDVFPEITTHRGIVERIIRAEEESFNATLDRGLEIFEEMISKPDTVKSRILAGSDAFMLYDTFGFPIDLTTLLAEERGFSVASDEFDVLLDAQKNRSRMVTKKRLAGAIDTSADGIQSLSPPDGAHSVFVGYDVTEVETRINTIMETESSCIVVLDETPFYAESGGQVSDTGMLAIGSDKYSVRGLLKRDGITMHVMDPELCGRLSEGDTVKACVDDARRRAIMRNHTATHLAHAALRSVLGTHVQQAGSAVDEHHLRFDFSHYARVEPDQIRAMEDLVNTVILDRRPVTQHRGISFDTARRMNALMFFGDKYGDFVNVIEVEGFSKEFCGGTHVGNTADIGMFKIISEGSVASGTRRIEAVTGMGVSRYIDSLIEKIGERNARETELLDRIKHLEKDLTKKALENADSEIDTLVKKALSVDGLRVVASRIEAESGDQLKNLGDKLREKIGSGVGVLAAVLDDKVSLVCVVTDDLIKQRGLKAGSIVGVLAKRLGGGGGGRPHLATAGGREVGKLDATLADIAAIIDEAVRG